MKHSLLFALTVFSIQGFKALGNLSNSKDLVIKKTDVTKKALTVKEEVGLLCSGTIYAYREGARKIIDDWFFDYYTPGRTKFPTSYHLNPWFEKDSTFTVAIRIDRSSISSVLNKSVTVGGKIYLSPNGPAITDESEKTVTLTENGTYALGDIIKQVKYSNGTFYFGCRVPQNSYIYNMSFVFGNKATTVNKIQVSKGTIEEFPGFVEEYFKPCYNTDRVLEDDTYIDVDVDNDNDNIISSLLNSTLAYDEEDGEYIRPKLISDEYSMNKTNLGIYYPVKLSATDKAGNTSYLTYYLRTVDKTLPVIRRKANDNIIFSYKDVTKEKILDLYEVTDNYQIKSFDIVDIDIEDLKSNIGRFEYRICAEDAYGNIQYFSDELNIIDDVAPIINAPISINATTSAKLTREELIGFINATDEIDGDDISITVDMKQYEENAKKPGRYAVTFKAVDKSNNSTTKTVTIKVEDKQGPSFGIYDSLIRGYVGDIVDVLEAINGLAEAGVIKPGKYISYELISGDDLTKATEVGTYKAKVLAKSENGDTILVNLKYEVKDRAETPKKQGFWDKIAAFFINIFTHIKNFFTSIF